MSTCVDGEVSSWLSVIDDDVSGDLSDVSGDLSDVSVELSDVSGDLSSDDLPSELNTL